MAVPMPLHYPEFVSADSEVPYPWAMQTCKDCTFTFQGEYDAVSGAAIFDLENY
jgi:hypothetical protein